MPALAAIDASSASSIASRKSRSENAAAFVAVSASSVSMRNWFSPVCVTRSDSPSPESPRMSRSPVRVFCSPFASRPATAWLAAYSS